MFQCCSLRTSNPCLLPQSLKVCLHRVLRSIYTCNAIRTEGACRLILSWIHLEESACSNYKESRKKQLKTAMESVLQNTLIKNNQSMPLIGEAEDCLTVTFLSSEYPSCFLSLIKLTIYTMLYKILMNKNHLPQNILLLPSEKIFATRTHRCFFLSGSWFSTTWIVVEGSILHQSSKDK